MEEAQYIRGPADSARIDLNEEHELQYWTKLLDVSETKLRAAVAFAGVMALDVRTYLGFPDAPPPVASRELGTSDCPDSYSSPEQPAALPAPAPHRTNYGRTSAPWPTSLTFHLLKRAR